MEETAVLLAFLKALREVGLTCTTSSGGKGPGATRSGTFFEPRQALLEETFAPQADDLAASVQAFGDLVIGEAFGGMEDHSGADNLKIR